VRSKGDIRCWRNPTAAPSIDIQVSSNFERLLLDLRDVMKLITAARMKWFEQMGKMVLSADMRKSCVDEKRAGRCRRNGFAMRWAHERRNEIIDPHTYSGSTLRAPLVPRKCR
jgi:threonine synthase